MRITNKANYIFILLIAISFIHFMPLPNHKLVDQIIAVSSINFKERIK